MVREETFEAALREGLGSEAAAEAVRQALADAEMDEANAWLDLPPCPNCRNAYRYNPRTGECRA